MPPSVLGYVRPPWDAAPGWVAARSVWLSGFASSRGWALVEVFAEDEPSRPVLALGALLAAARACRLVAVLISCPQDLGTFPDQVVAVRRRIEWEAGVPVVVAPGAPGPVLLPWVAVVAGGLIASTGGASRG